MKSFSNHEIVTLAVYILGGDSQYVDTEDVAVKVNEIAPGRFTWKKYPNQINIENVRTFLSDAKKPKNGNYLLGSGKKGWHLTRAGLTFAQNRVKELAGVDLTRKPLGTREQRWQDSERLRLLSNEGFLKYQSAGVDAVTLHEAEAFFRVDDYVVGEARERKVVRVLNAFGGDPELGQFVKHFADKVLNR